MGMNINKKTLATTYSSTLLCVVPSAKKGLTSEFGMGSGITPSLLSPRKRCFFIKKNREKFLTDTKLCSKSSFTPVNLGASQFSTTMGSILNSKNYADDENKSDQVSGPISMG